MAGYKRKVKTTLIKFADPEFDGFECEVKSLPVGEYLRVADLATKAGQGTESAKALFETFARCLVRWNLEDDEGVPVPANYEGVIGQDFDFAIAVVTGWMESMGGVDDELGKGSPSGVTFPEGSLPMEVSSPSLAS